MKTFRNAIREYGWRLRHHNGGERHTDKGRYWYEKFWLYDGKNKIRINDVNIIRFIKKVGVESFREENEESYKNYVKLFKMLGVDKIEK